MKKDSAESVFDHDRGEATRQPVVHRWHDGVVEHVGLGEALRAAGVLVGGAGLQSPQTATTVSVREGKRHVQDGPYAETKEFLVGFAIIDVPNLDAALEWVARNPAASCASVEVRPLLGWMVADRRGNARTFPRRAAETSFRLRASGDRCCSAHAPDAADGARR